MFHKYQYWYFKKTIPSEQIDLIINLCEQNNLQSATIDTENPVLDYKKRDCSISWCNKNKSPSFIFFSCTILLFGISKSCVATSLLGNSK